MFIATQSSTTCMSMCVCVFCGLINGYLEESSFANFGENIVYTLLLNP